MIQTATTVTTPRFETPAETLSPIAVVSPRTTWWGAIVAGALSAISIQIVLTVLGTAIGLTVIGASDDAPERGLSIGAGIWWLVTGLISLFLGGWVAGRLCASNSRFIGTMHGFLAWCTVTVMSALLMALAGGTAMAGSLSLVDNAISSGATGERLNLQGDAGNPETGATNSNNNPVPPLTETQQKEAAENAAGAAWWTLVALVLGAGVASIGGASGVRCREAHHVERHRNADDAVH